MADLIQVRSKGRAPYWISRGLFEKHPSDYTEVKPRAKAAAKKPAPETPASPAE